LKSNIQTSRLELRTCIPSDAQFLLEFYTYNKEHLQEWEPIRNKEFYTYEYHLNQINLRKNYCFLLFKKGNNHSILGIINISNISRGVFLNCNIGYKLDKNETGNGYMKEGLDAIIHFIFNELKLHRIEANVIPKNKSSIKVLESLHFRNEGLAKDLLKINGKWEDHFRYALLNDSISSFELTFLF